MVMWEPGLLHRILLVTKDFHVGGVEYFGRVAMLRVRAKVWVLAYVGARFGFGVRVRVRVRGGGRVYG